MGDDDTVVPFVKRVREDDDGTIQHFLAKVPGYPRVKCRHERFWVDETNHEVTCRDCNAIVQPFDALLAFSSGLKDYQQRHDAMKAEHTKLTAWKPWLKAVRKLEEVWRGTMLPCCPHCNRGIEAQALADGALINKAIATRMREVEIGAENGTLRTDAPEEDGGG